MKKFSLPLWTKSLPNNSYLNSKEVAVIFGYSGIGSLDRAMKKGLIPLPDKRASRQGRAAYNMWSVGLLRSLASP